MADSDDSPRALVCIIAGESTPFRVELAGNKDIIDLKDLIKEKGINSTEHAEYLILWMPMEDTPVIPSDTLPKRVENLIQGRRIAELDPRDIVAVVWPEQPNRKHLHIIVAHPSVLDDDDRPFLKRLRLDYVDYRWPYGWRRLSDDSPWKLFGDYWRKKKVETMSDDHTITLAYDERGKEDPTYRLPLAPETDNKIIVRDCYKSFYDYILRLRSEKRTGLVLTGQPGTGKTLWLSYALVRLLTENETVVFYSNDGTHLFFGDSVYLRTKKGEIPPADSAMFCLIDLDKEKNPTSASFMSDRELRNRTFPVMASSPMPSRYASWVKQRASVPTEYMPLWEGDELKKGLKLQSFYDDLRQDVRTVLSAPSLDDSPSISLKRNQWRNHIVSALKMIKDGDDATDNAPEVDEVVDKVLDDVIGAYGSSPEDVYQAINLPSLAEERITNALRPLNYDSVRNAVINIGLVEPDEKNDPHTIFSMDATEPVRNTDDSMTSVGFRVQFKSRWIRTMVLQKLEFLQHLEPADMIKEMAAVTGSSYFAGFLNEGFSSLHTSSFAGFLYEGFAVNELTTGASPGLVMKEMKAEEGTTTFFVPNEGRPIDSPFNRLRERLYPFSTGPLGLKFDIPPGKCLSDYFWIPMIPNNLLFDAFVIEFNGSAPNINAVVWILQMTLSTSRGGSADDYSIIRSIKKKVQEAMGTTEKPDVIVRYVLVSPDAGRWTLPEKNRRSCKGDVYYQRVQIDK